MDVMDDRESPSSCRLGGGRDGGGVDGRTGEEDLVLVSDFCRVGVGEGSASSWVPCRIDELAIGSRLCIRFEKKPEIRLEARVSTVDRCRLRLSCAVLGRCEFGDGLGDSMGSAGPFGKAELEACAVLGRVGDCGLVTCTKGKLRVLAASEAASGPVLVGVVASILEFTTGAEASLGSPEILGPRTVKSS